MKEVDNNLNGMVLIFLAHLLTRFSIIFTIKTELLFTGPTINSNHYSSDDRLPLMAGIAPTYAIWE